MARTHARDALLPTRGQIVSRMEYTLRFVFIVMFSPKLRRISLQKQGKQGTIFLNEVIHYITQTCILQIDYLAKVQTPCYFTCLYLGLGRRCCYGLRKMFLFKRQFNLCPDCLSFSDVMPGRKQSYAPWFLLSNMLRY